VNERVATAEAEREIYEMGWVVVCLSAAARVVDGKKKRALRIQFCGFLWFRFIFL
jgi:hypothetical protein